MYDNYNQVRLSKKQTKFKLSKVRLDLIWNIPIHESRSERVCFESKEGQVPIIGEFRSKMNSSIVRTLVSGLLLFGLNDVRHN